MTTTAHEDQFTAEPEPVRQPYDTGSILRRNVADLEIALKQQTERAEAAEEKLTTAREDMQSWIDSRNGWMERAGAAEAELVKLREQEPVAWCDPVEFRDDPWSFQGFRCRTNRYPTMPLYASPVPAVTAVAVVQFSDNELDEIHQLAYELGGTENGEYILDGEQLDQVIVKAASLFYKPAVAVPEGWGNAVREFLESHDAAWAELISRLPTGITSVSVSTHQADSVKRANVLRALLQSTGDKK